MWYLEKQISICSSHNLRNYEGKCKNLHGHNWDIVVKCKSDSLDEKGMVIDFGDIKDIAMKYDHANLNDFEEFKICNPTAENIAKVLLEQIPHCHEVIVEETKGNKVIYVED